MSNQFKPITTIRKTPSRIGNPSSFRLDSNIFLTSLPLYQSQINDNVDFYNVHFNFNKTDYGKVVSDNITPVYTEMQSTIPIPSVGDMSFTSNVDKFYKEMVDRVNIENNVGKWFEKVQKARVNIPMSGKVSVTTISTPMQTGQTISQFNSSANNFSVSTKGYTQSLSSLFNQVKDIIKPRDYGSVNDVVSNVIDAGSITDVVVN